MTATSPSDPLVGRLIDSRYQIESFIARGGMATVYKATDTRLNRTVAIKVMHPTLAEDPDFVRRFEREARSAATFSHPAVVAVHDQGVDGELVYLAMEYVDGTTLRGLLRDQGSLSAPIALSILEPVLDALSAAHRAGFVHRDVKPENILISTTGQVKIADFGLARAIEDSTASQVTQGVLIGTVAYLAPEQVKTGHADQRSDVYSAGIILYECVVGQTPFVGATPLSVAYQHVNDDVTPPSQANPDVPPVIDELVLVATNKDPEQRYADAADFSHHVHAIRSTLDPNDSQTHLTIAIPHQFEQPVSATPANINADPVPVAEPMQSEQPTTQVEMPPQPEEAAHDGAGGSDSGGSQAGGPAAEHGQSQLIRPHRFRGLIAAIVLLALILSFGIGAWRWAEAQSVPVPSVVGMTQTKAKATLAQERLSLDVTGQEFSDTVKRGVIISTDPAPGEGVALEGVVRAIVSSGPENVKVPKVAGLSETAAKNKLDDANLSAQVVEEFHDKVASGTAIEVRPASGTKVKSGSTVELVISKGPPPVTVPNVVTMSKDDAIARLQSLGLKVVTQGQLPVVVIGRVYSQDPGGGTTVPKGSTVTLTLV